MVFATQYTGDYGVAGSYYGPLADGNLKEDCDQEGSTPGDTWRLKRSRFGTGRLGWKERFLIAKVRSTLFGVLELHSARCVVQTISGT